MSFIPERSWKNKTPIPIKTRGFFLFFCFFIIMYRKVREDETNNTTGETFPPKCKTLLQPVISPSPTKKRKETISQTEYHSSAMSVFRDSDEQINTPQRQTKVNPSAPSLPVQYYQAIWRDRLDRRRLDSKMMRTLKRKVK